jgi:hypothetical protein
MLDRPFRWRVALIASGFLLGIFMWANRMFDSKKAIVIDYAMLGDDAIGAEVYIDDELAGTLQALRPAHKTGFEVSEGTHTVYIVHPAYACEPVRVETQGSRSTLLLRLDVASYYDEQTGEEETRIVFEM